MSRWDKKCPAQTHERDGRRPPVPPRVLSQAAADPRGGLPIVPLSSNTYIGLPDELITSVQIEIGTLRKGGFLFSDEVEDFEQELVLHGWRILPRFEPETQVPLQCFLNQAIHRQAISLLRGRRSCNRIPRGMEASYEELCETLDESYVEDQLARDVTDPSVTPHEDLMVSLDLRSVFERLPERQQTLVKLLQSNTVSEAAREMGVSRAVVYTLLTDVREALTEAGYAPPSRQSNREKLPMQNAASALGISTPAETAAPSTKPDRMKTSYSMWSLFRNCRRAAQLRYLDNIVPIERDPNLAFGSLIHDCLERWHRDQDLPAEVQKTKDRNERLLTEIGKAGAAAGLALTTGNPAAALPLLAVIGKRLLEALTADEPATAQ